MKLISTRGGPQAGTWSFRSGLFLGQAPDGGLFVPESLPRLSTDQLDALRQPQSFAERAKALALHLLGDEITADILARVVDSAFDFPVPLAKAEQRVRILELFRGPTCAFKDVGARFMAQMTAALRSPDAPSATVLAATSGDTGAAVARAFHGVPGTRIVVLYPLGRVSDRQEAQFTTLGGNVIAVAIRGDFDDCQRLAKQAFADPVLRSEAGLTSANSINIGRLLPQMFYYAHAWAELPESERDQDVVFSVPSGNFGNLAAGLMARAVGIPIARFVAATNANRVVPDYLASGAYEPRPATPTVSTAMDVGDPSNFARILHGFAHDLEALGKVVAGSSWSDDETRECIRREWQKRGAAADPHTAVGLLGLRRELAVRKQSTGIALATAHPAKFAEVVEPLIGCPVPIPAAMERLLDLPRNRIAVEPKLEALRDILASASTAASSSTVPAQPCSTGADICLPLDPPRAAAVRP